MNVLHRPVETATHSSRSQFREYVEGVDQVPRAICVLTIFVLVGCSSEIGLKSTHAQCEPIDFVPSPDVALPVGFVENGLYLFVDGAPRSKACIRERVCQANDWTMEHAHQSYYIELDSVGGKELARQFPDVVEQNKEGFDPFGRQLNLNHFCIATQ